MKSRGGLRTLVPASLHSGDGQLCWCALLVSLLTQVLLSHSRWLSGYSTQEAVQQMLDDGVDVLIDLNGHTLRTGLPLFTYKPALVQLTFLGYPLTTALPFIDHVIVDKIAYPPHVSVAHTEKFVRPS
jgi:predicted O-linked N-acetylglucosamine transferase (SPINDLY family)